VLALMSRGGGHVVEVGLSIASVAYGALLGVFLLGTLTKSATETGAMIGMIGGLAGQYTALETASCVALYLGTVHPVS
jgi:Na+/proline symporter